jgi:hypothetical protein
MNPTWSSLGSSQAGYAQRWAARAIVLEVDLSDWPSLFNNALIYGIGLSLVLTTIMIVSGVIAPDMWVGKYPPDIRQRYGPMSLRAARLRPYIAVSFFMAVLVVPILGLFALRAEVDDVPFNLAFAFSSVALLVFNTFDLIVLDWLFFCTIQPRPMVLPGTEGMPGYHDYRFHFIGFLKGLIFCAVGGLFIALLWVVVQRLTT